MHGKIKIKDKWDLTNSYSAIEQGRRKKKVHPISLMQRWVKQLFKHMWYDLLNDVIFYWVLDMKNLGSFILVRKNTPRMWSTLFLNFCQPDSFTPFRKATTGCDRHWSWISVRSDLSHLWEKIQPGVIATSFEFL